MAPLDKDLIRRAIEASDLNVLRLALYQQTSDPTLAAMKVIQQGRAGNPFKTTVLAPEHHDVVKQKALEFACKGKTPPVIPSKAKTLEMMELFYGGPLSEANKEYCWEDLSFNGFERGVKWNTPPLPEKLEELNVTIIGAGFSAIIAAIQFKRLGIKFRMIERQAGLGGTWWLNDYPEARVDVTTFLYQFKFEDGFTWKHYFATQPEIQEYINFIVDKYNLRDHITLNTKVTHANWDEDAKKWRLMIEGPDGTSERIESTFFISASGQFSTARLPDIAGINDFTGKMFHSTEWDHDYDLTGKRVAVIGTGSTGSQMTRGIAEKASSVTVYQRTPNWLTRMPNYRDEVSAEVQWLLANFPGYKNWFILGQHLSQLRLDGMNEIDPEWQAKGGIINEKNDALRTGLKRYIMKQVKGDKDLYDQLVPHYSPLARRLVIDNDWYATLTENHVELVSGPINHFTQTGIVSKDGKEREFDLVILSAGFFVERFLWPVQYKGRDGATLDDLWSKDGPRAYITAMLPRFPNFAMMYGPNSGLTSGSLHSWIELFSRYFCKVIIKTIESGASTFEVKYEAYKRFNDDMDERAKTWVYHVEKGGGGYYMNKHGRSSVRLPWKLDEYYDIVKNPDYDDFKFET